MTRGAGDGYHCAAEVYAPLPHRGVDGRPKLKRSHGLCAVGTDERAARAEKDLLQYWADGRSCDLKPLKNDFEVTAEILKAPSGPRWPRPSA